MFDLTDSLCYFCFYTIKTFFDFYAKIFSIYGYYELPTDLYVLDFRLQEFINLGFIVAEVLEDCLHLAGQSIFPLPCSVFCLICDELGCISQNGCRRIVARGSFEMLPFEETEGQPHDQGEEHNEVPSDISSSSMAVGFLAVHEALHLQEHLLGPVPLPQAA